MSSKRVKAVSAWEGIILRAAARDSLRKLDPRIMVGNPVMFVVEVGSVLTTLVWLRDLVAPSSGALAPGFTGQLALWLWFTVLFANFAESVAEGRGKAQAAALRGLRQETLARRLVDGMEEAVPASTLRKGKSRASPPIPAPSARSTSSFGIPQSVSIPTPRLRRPTRRARSGRLPGEAQPALAEREAGEVVVDHAAEDLELRRGHGDEVDVQPSVARAEGRGRGRGVVGVVAV